MRYIRFYGSTPYCGTDYEEFKIFDDAVSDSTLDDIAEEYRLQNADTFAYLATGWDEEEEDEHEENPYYEDCDGSWEEYPDEKHWKEAQE